MTDGPVCELCGTDEVFRTRLWRRVCVGCGKSHTVCGACIADWGLRLGDPRSPSNWNSGGRRLHLDCPDAARVALELMRPERADFDPGGFREMREQLARAVKNCFVSTMEDFTDVAAVLKDTFKLAGASVAEVAEAATLLAAAQVADAVREAAEEAKA